MEISRPSLLKFRTMPVCGLRKLKVPSTARVSTSSGGRDGEELGGIDGRAEAVDAARSPPQHPTGIGVLGEGIAQAEGPAVSQRAGRRSSEL